MTDCLALPKNDNICYIEMCINCEDKEATRCRGYGIYHSAICDTCYFRYVMNKP